MTTDYPTNPLSNLSERKDGEVVNPLVEYVKEKIATENAKANQPSELDRAMERLSHTPDGQLVLNWIMRECGYQETGLEITTQGEISTRLLIKNEAQRHVWCVIRKLIPHGVRHIIEDPKPREKETDGRSTTDDN